MICGRTDADFVDAEVAKYFREQDQAMFEEGCAKANEEWVTYPDGRKVYLETLKSPFYDAQGTLLGLIGVSRDITRRREHERERDLLHFTVAASLNEIYIFDALTLSFDFCNAGALSNLGYSMDEMRGMTPLDIKPFFTAKSFNVLVGPLVSREKMQLVFETFHRRKNGTMYPVEVHLQRFDQGDNHVFLAIVQDISARLSAEQRLRLASRVFEASAQGILICDEHNTISLVNKAFSRITGYSQEEAIGRNPRILSSGMQGPHFYQQMWDAINDAGHWAGEVWNRRKSGEIYPQWLEITVLKNDEGQFENYIALFSDITTRKANEDNIRRLAQHDYLTGLPNRALFTERFSQVLSLAQRKQELFGLVYLDLDHFKEINDTLGHHVGDLLLQEVARRLSGAIRLSDTVCRMGGDEFILLVPGVESLEDMTVLADKLIALIGAPYHAERHELAVTPSIGIALFPQHGEDMDSLMRRADIAMYQAKSDGRNGYRFFEAGMLPDRQ